MGRELSVGVVAKNKSPETVCEGDRERVEWRGGSRRVCVCVKGREKEKGRERERRGKSSFRVCALNTKYVVSSVEQCVKFDAKKPTQERRREGLFVYEKARESMCVFLCVCDKEREREAK